MIEWEKVKVGDIGKVITGKTPKTSNCEYYGGNIPFLTPSDDMSVKYVRRTNKYITELGRLSVKNATLPANAICVSCIGSDLGKVVITTQETVTNQQINSIVVDTDKFDIDFVYYSMLELGKILNFHSKTSTAVPIVNKSSFSQYEIDCPKLNTQKKIGAILSSIDKKIEENNQINNNLEQQVSALYESWFEDFDPTNGVCPDNWSNQMLSTIANISSGKRPPIKSEVYSQETPISIVGAASVMGFTSEANHTDKILVTGRVGTHGVIQRFNTPCWTSDNTLVITSPFYEFTNQILHRIDYSSMNRGSTQPLITQGDMKKVVVLVPDEETLAKFEALTGSLMAQWEANNNENVKLASLRDTLLPKLMSGVLDVSDIDL
ncbi:restriction endonuclease subunit S [Anaerovoracaceae bacterium SGI.195]